MKFAFAATLALCTVVHADSTAAEHWSQFRGPLAAGVAKDDASPPTKFGLDNNLDWSCELPTGHSSPAVRGDRIFVTGYDQDAKELTTFCISREDGSVLWQRSAKTAEIERVHKVSSPATATPVADDERVYVYFGSFGLLCYDLDGNEKWSLALPIPSTRFGSGTSPILVGERLILSRDAGDTKYLVSVDCQTGEIAWKTPLSDAQLASYATPVVWRDMLVLHRFGEVAAFSIDDGKPRWRVPVSTSGCSTPVIGDNLIYVATWNNGGEAELRVELPRFADLLKEHDKDEDGKLSRKEFPKDLAVTKRPEAAAAQGGEVLLVWFFDRLDFNKDKRLGAFEWGAASTMMKLMVKEHGLLAIRLGDGENSKQPKIVWREKRAVPETPSPLYYQQHVYMVKNGGILSCMQADSGKLVYRKRLNAPGSYYSSPVAADGRLFFASENGVITVVSAGRRFKVLARNDLGQSIKATPAIIGKHVYVRTHTHLHAFASE